MMKRVASLPFVGTAVSVVVLAYCVARVAKAYRSAETERA